MDSYDHNYVDLEFDDSQVASVSDLLDPNDPYALETLLQEFVDYSIEYGLFRYYVESKSARSAVNQAPKWKEGNESNEVTQ